MKENLKPCVYKLWERFKAQPRTFCRTVRRVAGSGEVKDGKSGAGGKPSLKRAKTYPMDSQSVYTDPKPGDLPMSRLKPL